MNTRAINAEMFADKLNLIFETESGTLVSADTIPVDLYPLGVHFASEQVRWLNGGQEPRLLTGMMK